VPGFLRWLNTRVGRVPVISSEIGLRSRLAAVAARLGIDRDGHRVPAGLYAVGGPDAASPVVVTANYALTYDHVRAALRGQSVWLLVLETLGVNVWCAAGKGTFGTGELVARIEAVRLPELVEHRRLVLPILGATGVAAHEVEARTGFRPRFAAVRATDLPAYFANGMKTQPSMRELSFSFFERAVLIPVELVGAIRWTALLSAIVFAVAAFRGGAFDGRAGLLAVTALVGAILAGTVGVPLALPLIPGRSFAFKGMLAGCAWAGLWGWLAGGNWSPFEWASAFLLLPAVTSFLALNFTGSTPFTSRSGVKKEMRYAIPLTLASCAAGVIVIVVGGFAGGG
jgi:acetyl-CoA decarbonylase/synthase complex subunit gamma